ncbi:MAG: MBL fold metallo-hydrolase [Clostridia bacterium]|nr:MBL fold metallo-hydrolase [Clostridia bacterium]
MKRKFLLSLSLITMLMCLFAISVSALTGAGTETDPYIVETAEDFMEINNNLSAHYKLNADISVSSNTGTIVEGTFSGVFDGGNHTIDVNIVGATSGTNTYDALFGVVSGKIKNLTVTGTVTGSDKVAGVAGKIIGSANVDNCINYATVSGRKNTGGIVGLLNSKTATISNCANFGSINGTTPISSGLDVGGIVGCVWDSQGSIANLTDCYNAGAITGNGYNVGGICGQFQGTYIKNCFSSGNVVSTTGSNAYGAFFGKIANCNSYAIDGYFCTTDIKFAGEGASKCVVKNYIIESAGVAIYLGNGSGIRGEFHINESMFNSFCSLAGYGPSSIEYGAVVSTKNEVIALNGNLISQEAKESGKVIFAPAMKNGEKQYSYADAVKGDGYHSYRFALTGFEDTRYSYNMEFVVLGYILLTDAKGNQQAFYVNSVVSDRLASAVADTGLNAVSIVRVAEATLDDGDFEGNETALNTLNHIVSLKDFATKIEIDGVVGYGHKSATFTKSISSEDTVVFKISNTDAEELNVYLSNLIAGGYEKISENEINGVKFYVFKAGTKLINLTCSSDLSEAVISYETLTNLPANLTKPTFEKVTDPSITQIKLETSIAEGMSYVIQLSDGTFLIIDGGWCDSNENEADKLYNTLASLAGEGNDIVIAGWIFTHCHGDHIGTFNFFVDKYHDNVTIKQILYNFPADNDILNSGSSYMLDESKQRYGYFKEVVATYLTDTEFVKLHSGYKFYYADAEIEIIQTLEDLYPSTVANYDFNSSSTIFTVTIAGQKMLFLGDVSDVGASRLNRIFGASLKSDFLQVAHHGLNNGGTIKDLYLNADATYILYPAPLSWYNSNAGASANFYLATESKTVKQIFVSGVQTVELYLPYDGKLYDGEKFPNIEIEEPDDERVEINRPNEPVEVPDAFFDLDIKGGTLTDTMGNATVTVTGGSVTETTVEHNGVETTTNTYTGDRYKEKYYMTVNFNEITSDEEWGNFVMDSSTFEIFLRLDKLPGQTVGLITSCNSGGTTLYLRKQAGGQLTFQIGSTNPNSNGSGAYSSTSDMSGSTPLAVSGDLIHIVGSYDKDTNIMKLYINGILVASADYGTGSFKGGAENDYILGICYNPQYSGEALSEYANYELFEAKIYDVALTDEQVAQEYWNCIDNLFETEAENE